MISTFLPARSNRLLNQVIAFIFVLSACASASAQCSITTSGPACVGEPIGFNCNSIGGSYDWDFNGEGTNTSACDPSFIFNSTGVKKITLKVTLANGSICSSSLNLNIQAKPEMKLSRVSSKVQCFGNNSYCFTDSSTAVPGKNIKRRNYFFDDGTRYTFLGDGIKSFCHSFTDPVGGTYGMTIETEESGGCVSQTYIPAIAQVLPSLGLTFSSPQPKRCDSVQLCITNNSLVRLDSLKSFSWNWGDGQITSGNNTTSSLWKTTICHWYKTQGPNMGSFTAVLKATTFSGCTDSFRFMAVATNLPSRPKIIADYDSVCIGNAFINFRLKDGPVIGGANPQFIYEQPQVPSNFTRNWTGSHRFTNAGPYRIAFNYTHTIPGCATAVYDTILVLGPQSIIEEQAGSSFMADSLRYQCIIKDTVRFTNFSRFYHNDRNMRDDDSTFNDPNGFNKPLGHKFSGTNNQASLKANPQNRGNTFISRLWDFDDDFCERCTTDTKKGINASLNCRYSKDSLPKHWYTPWEDLYTKTFGAKAIFVNRYNKDSGYFISSRLWSDDSVAIVRDTILYYGDNALAVKSRDSAIYKSIGKKIRKPNAIRGISRTDFKNGAAFYIETGNTVYVDEHTGGSLKTYTGPRYLSLLPGQSLIINSTSSRALYHVWLQTSQDTIPLYLANSTHRIFRKEKAKGFITGDSVNSASHRQKFYSGDIVRCYQAKLWQKDTRHPMACASESVVSLSLQPASAKGLRKAGIQCLGADNSGYGISFILDETKPGCSRTWAEINFDTAKNKNAWVPAIGKNLTSGQISVGALPPLNQPFLAFGGVQGRIGSTPNIFSKQYTRGELRDTINGYVHVGLIIGNGIWKNGTYPEACQDTVYYPKFARFPVLDNSFSITNPAQGNEYTYICKKQPISLSNYGNHSNVQDVKSALWTLTSSASGKYFNQMYELSVRETYKRFVSIHKDSSYLVDQLSIVKRSLFGDKYTTQDSQTIRIAKVTKWHTEADIYQVYSQVKDQLSVSGIDITELSATELSNLIWNGQGTIGKAYTGSRGLIDTTGFGSLILFTTIADEKQILHYRDTSLLPVDMATNTSGQIHHAYTLTPQYTGYFIANYSINSNLADACPKASGAAKKVIVGFYGQMNYSDTILCHEQQVLTSPDFRYFEVYPEVTFRLLDPTDYWRDRVQEAGNPRREGFTRTDLNKNDDNPANPKTIFGGFPWSITGMDNRPNNVLQLGGLTNSIYYNADTGLMYTIRTATSDSFGCVDTFTQNIFTTALRAKFRLTQNSFQCKNIITFKDSSYVADPYFTKYGTHTDSIVKYTINWGDGWINTFYDNLPESIAHDYVAGYYTVTLDIESELGCKGSTSASVFINDPAPYFDTLIRRNYCVGEEIKIVNNSRYNKADSVIWIWSFGDGTYDNQYDTLIKPNDIIKHSYAREGTYDIVLYLSYKKRNGSNTRCLSAYPDSSLMQDKFTVNISKCDSTGIDVQLNNPNIRMYPNPAHHTMTLSSEQKTDIIIIDAMGRIVKSFVHEGEKSVDLKNLAPGLYVVATRDRQVIGKLIIE
jgi:hypothetical protein